MEVVAFVFFILSTIAYLVLEDYMGHFWGTKYLNTAVLLLLITFNDQKDSSIDEVQIILIFLGITMFLFSGIFLLRSNIKNEKIDEIDQ